MATKGKDKILEGQIAFDFFGEIEQAKVIKPKKEKVINIETKKEIKKAEIKIFRKVRLNIKHNHFKKARKVRRILMR